MVSQYDFAGECDYLYIAAISKTDETKRYKFENKKIYIYSQTDWVEIDTDELIVNIKSTLSQYQVRIAKFEKFLLEYEKIFTNRALCAKFTEKYDIKKYDFKKLYAKISDLTDALQLCMSEQIWLRSRVKEVYYEAKLFGDSAKDAIARLDDIKAHITGLKTDKITKNIYVLTIISAVFLPLNLITGFFGMNTKGLFFDDFQNGTTLVLAIILAVGVTFAMSWYFFDKNR